MWHFLRGATHHKGVCHTIVYRGPRQVCCVAHGKWCATHGDFTGSHAWLFWKLLHVVLFIQAATRGPFLYKLPRVVLFIQAATRGPILYRLPCVAHFHLVPCMVHTNHNHRHYSTCTLLYYTIDCKCIVLTSLCLTQDGIHSEAFRGRRLPAVASADILILLNITHIFLLFLLSTVSQANQ